MSKAFLGTAIVLWAWQQLRQRKYVPLSPLAVILSLWFADCLISSFAGFNPARSTVETLKTGFFLLTPFAVAPFFLSSDDQESPNPSSAFLFKRICKALSYFFIGQTIAAIHTLLKEGVTPEIPQIIPGELTESGQIVVLAPLIALFLLSRDLRTKRNLFQICGTKISALPLTYFGTIVALNIVSIWPNILCRGTIEFCSPLVGPIALAASLFLVAVPFFNKKSVKRALPLAIWACAGLVFSALIINLKRGPWVGVVVELLIIGFLFSSKLVKWTLGLALLAVVFLDPVRSRVDSLVDHFTISGGRKEMWSIGSELVQRFPLGVGHQNAKVIREIDPSLPPTHRHLHNNLLNVTVELGWIGLTIFLMWMVQIIRIGIMAWRRVSGDNYGYSSKRIGQLGLFLSISFFGWQLAGMVEYNFGDGEIRMLTLFMMGILIAVEQETRRVQKLAKVIRFKERKVA